MQPRSAVAYMAVAALVCAERCGAAPALAAEVEAAVAPLRGLGERIGPAAGEDSPAKLLARSLSGRVPTVYGAGPAAACARRWQTQLNENAAVDAHCSELPEADHNEICAFADGGSGRAAVFLEDPDAPERIRRRIELTADLARESGHEVARVEAVGDSPFARVMSLVLFGDLVSIYLAALRGIDPTPVETIDRLKRELG
jgi:glucose/mannose-6-phosphate isomerase